MNCVAAQAIHNLYCDGCISLACKECRIAVADYLAVVLLNRLL